MKTFRATVRRTDISTEIVEFQAKDLRSAAAQIQDYATANARPRSFMVVRPHDQDGDSTRDDVVVSLHEKR